VVAQAERRTFSLPPEQATLMAEQIASGRYASAHQVAPAYDAMIRRADNAWTRSSARSAPGALGRRDVGARAPTGRHSTAVVGNEGPWVTGRARRGEVRVRKSHVGAWAV
jgi:hypothetical protein